MELCLFKIDQAVYALPMSSVREVLSRPRISPVPLSPNCLSGITHFRGEVIPVFTIAQILEPTRLPEAQTEKNRVLVLNHKHQTLGIQVDQINELNLNEELAPLVTDLNGLLLGECVTHKKHSFQVTSLSVLTHKLQQALSEVTLNLQN